MFTVVLFPNKIQFLFWFAQKTGLQWDKKMFSTPLQTHSQRSNAHRRDSIEPEKNLFSVKESISIHFKWIAFTSCRRDASWFLNGSDVGSREGIPHQQQWKTTEATDFIWNLTYTEEVASILFLSGKRWPSKKIS